MLCRSYTSDCERRSYRGKHPSIRAVATKGKLQTVKAVVMEGKLQNFRAVAIQGNIRLSEP